MSYRDDAWETLLLDLGWSKAELARRCGVHRNTVSKWRSAPPYALEIMRLACALMAAGDLARRGG